MSFHLVRLIIYSGNFYLRTFEPELVSLTIFLNGQAWEAT